MTKPFIREGDRTSHGGTVISGDTTMIVDGKPLARVGDLTVCPRCKGIFPITSGLTGFFSAMGQAAAVHGDKTACGATLLAGSVLASAGNDGGDGSASEDSRAAAAATASAAVAADAPTICLECLAAAAATGSPSVVRDGA